MSFLTSSRAFGTTSRALPQSEAFGAIGRALPPSEAFGPVSKAFSPSDELSAPLALSQSDELLPHRQSFARYHKSFYRQTSFASSGALSHQVVRFGYIPISITEFV